VNGGASVVVHAADCRYCEGDERYDGGPHPYVRTCDRLRPGTMGYQRCIRPEGHDFKHLCQDGKEFA